jgi:hypothetical protein
MHTNDTWPKIWAKMEVFISWSNFSLSKNNMLQDGNFDLHRL